MKERVDCSANEPGFDRDAQDSFPLKTERVVARAVFLDAACAANLACRPAAIFTLLILDSGSNHGGQP